MKQWLWHWALGFFQRGGWNKDALSGKVGLWVNT